MFNEIKTTYETAQILAMTQRNVAGICKRGYFPRAFKKGKTWLIPDEDIKIYILTHGNKKIRNKNAAKNLAATD